MDHAVTSGRVRYAGVSNFVGWQTAQAATWQRAVPGPRPAGQRPGRVLAAGPRAEVEVLPALRAFGMGCFPWSPLGRGRADRAVPSRHAARLAGRDRPLRLVRRALPGAAQPRRGRGRRPGGRGPGPHPAAGRAALGPRRARASPLPCSAPGPPASSRPRWPTEELTLPPEIASALDDVSGGPNALRPHPRAPRQTWAGLGAAEPVGQPWPDVDPVRAAHVGPASGRRRPTTAGRRGGSRCRRRPPARHVLAVRLVDGVRVVLAVGQVLPVVVVALPQREVRVPSARQSPPHWAAFVRR